MSANSSASTLPLLYIDDSPNDCLLVQEAIRCTETPFALYTADGPDSAAAYFWPFALKPDRNLHPHPAVVLLDYDMGIHTGVEFLYWLRVQMKITSVPVIMYSGSAGARNVLECYASGANHFLSKPRALTGVQTIIRCLYCCMSFHPPRFKPLTQLPEYQPDPRSHEKPAQSIGESSWSES